MKNKGLMAVAILAIVVGFAGVGFAHHGQVEYDMNKSVTIMGTVTKFEWTNPHCILTLNVKGENDSDKTEAWNVEILPPSQMTRAGWSRGSIQAGDQVTLVGRPGKKGVHIMWLQSLTMPDGRKLARNTDAR